MVASLVCSALIAASATKPNIVLVVADDLGYAELGCYGQHKIHTPNIDRMAAEGIRFTQFYAGAPVCAPSRCCLMTGLQSNHAYIRDNGELPTEGQMPLPEGTVTMAGALKQAGYTTGMFGKWGLGGPGTTGDPMNMGWDEFYGYNCQREAHNYYPDHLWHNREKVTLEGNEKGNIQGKQYSHDLIVSQAFEFVKKNQTKPFFLYMPVTIPHVALQVPEDSLKEYEGKFEDIPYDGKQGYLPHPTPRAAYAAMITRLDRDMGRLFSLLKDLDLDKHTVVVFTSDNGPTHAVGGADPAFFDSADGLRGLKGSVYEGGIRVPMVVRWPGHIDAGRTTEQTGAFWDLLPTFLTVAGARTPKGLDGLSLMPTMTGRGKQKMHRRLIWEFPGYGGQQAVREGDWKAVRTNMSKGNNDIELYNLKDDPGEKTNLAKNYPDKAAHFKEIMAKDRKASDLFHLKGLDR